MAADDAVLTIYSTVWCGYCTRLKRQLERAGVPFRDVDIEDDPAAEARVLALNNGNATVPTVVLPDGTALTNPTFAELHNRLGLTA